MTLVVLDAAVACQRQAAVQHWALPSAEANWVQVVRTRVARAGCASAPLGQVHLRRAPAQRVPQPLCCLYAFYFLPQLQSRHTLTQV